jgi:hypothetical protein
MRFSLKREPMKTISVAFICIFLLLLCSCATEDSIRPQLPAHVTMNKEAGRGGHLIVTLRLENGEEVPFQVDTGAPITVFDKSLEPKLGKRLGTTTILMPGSDSQKSGIYRSPKLYLGDIPLATAGNALVYDLKRPMGILGMDCLRHYCLQLDFEAGQMRFLDHNQMDAAKLGKAFPLTFSGVGPQGKFVLPFIHQDSLIGATTNLLIDTGCNIDGLVEEGAIKGLAVILPECIWEGETCTNLIVAAVNHVNALGLSFLARHLVTFDFPKQTMYLKQTSGGPLAGDIMMEISDSEKRASAEYLEGLKKKGQLPGLSKDDQGAVYFESYFNSGSKSANFDFQKNDDLFIYHYTVGRASEDSPWKLQKAWQTDTNGHSVKEYSVPQDFQPR